VAALAIAELWAQGKRPLLPGWHGPNQAAGLIDAHPTRLWGMSEAVGVQNAEGSVASINALGFRGKMPEQPKPQGRLRVLSTGDSSFYGFGVNDSEVFTDYMEQSLLGSGQDVDVINTGVGGYTIAQHVLVMEEIGWDLEPDLLILANLWSDNTWDSFHDEDLLRSNRFAAANPLTRSALVKLIAAWWGKDDPLEGGRVIVWSASEGWPEGKIRRVPLSRWMSMHDELLQAAASRGIGAVFLKPTNSFLLGPEHAGPPPAWTPYFEAMDALAAHHHIPVVDVTAVFKAAMDEGVAATDLLWDKMHPTAMGHRVLSDAILAALSAASWPKNRLLPSVEPYDGLPLEDLPNPVWTDDAGAGSPQLKLFDLSEADKAAVAGAAKAATAQGAPKHDGGPVPEDGPVGQPPKADVHERVEGLQRGVWSLAITVANGRPPYEVEVLDADGNIVGRARLSKPNRFSLKIPQAAPTVSVVVTDKTGDRVDVGAGLEAPTALLDLGD